MNYFETLIAVADDCPVTRALVPEGRGGKKTVAVLQYEMLAEHPFEYTQEDVLFAVWLTRQGLAGETPERIALLRAEFWSKPQACMRTSPLSKQYGWGLLFDHQGRVALCPMDSRQYQEVVADGKTRVVKAMRSSRS